ncbi:MAG TPA: hypothetical protein VFH36_15860 [Acidimicrobiales bacterium]|nr:hypothetical protein [Acidimicrobiales bacterium]
MTTTVQSSVTCTGGVNACWSSTGSDVGVRLTLIGVDHVSPPLVDC